MMAGDGVSTYLALIFGTLLSSQGTDASFVLTLAGFPPGASLRSCVSDSIRPFPDPISSALSRFPLSRFSFRRVRLYQILSGLTPSQRGSSSRLLGRSDASNFSGSLRQFLIGPPDPDRIEFGHAEFTPTEGSCWWFDCRFSGGGAVAEPFRSRDNSENFTDPPGQCQPSPVKIF